MDKRIKILLISLGIVSLFAAGAAAWIYITSEAEVARYSKRQTELERQSTYLQEKLDTSQKEARHWREKSEAITTALNRLGKEHTLLESQYDSLLREKESLAEQNTTLSGQLEKLDKLYSQEQEKARLGTSDKFLASVLKEKATLEVEIEKLKGKISSQEVQFEDAEKRTEPSKERLERLEKELQDACKISDVLSSDLLKEKKTRTNLEEELGYTESQLKALKQERDKLSEQLVKMKQALEQRLAQLSQTKKILESAVEEAKEIVSKRQLASIELPPIVVRAQEPQVPTLVDKKAPDKKAPDPFSIEEETLQLEGRIITVNDKYRFAVIDIGRDEGVEKGMNFDVYRKGGKVGKIEVIETRKSIAACDVKEMSVRRLKVSDVVRR